MERPGCAPRDPSAARPLRCRPLAAHAAAASAAMPSPPPWPLNPLRSPPPLRPPLLCAAEQRHLQLLYRRCQTPDDLDKALKLTRLNYLVRWSMLIRQPWHVDQGTGQQASGDAEGGEPHPTPPLRPRPLQARGELQQHKPFSHKTSQILIHVGACMQGCCCSCCRRESIAGGAAAGGALLPLLGALLPPLLLFAPRHAQQTSRPPAPAAPPPAHPAPAPPPWRSKR